MIMAFLGLEVGSFGTSGEPDRGWLSISWPIGVAI